MGGVVVNTNPLYTPTELEHQLQDSGAETIVIAENFAHTLQKALPNTPIKTIIKTSVGDMLGTVRGAVTKLVVRHVKKLIPAYSLPNTRPEERRVGKACVSNIRYRGWWS